MADNLKAEVKLSAPVLQLRDDYAIHVTELAGRIVKQEKSKLYVLIEAPVHEFTWIEVK